MPWARASVATGDPRRHRRRPHRPAGCRYVSSPTPIGWNPYPVRPPHPQRRPRHRTHQRRPAATSDTGHHPATGASFSRARNIVRRWTGFLDHLRLIVSDFLYFPGQRDRGPTMSFIPFATAVALPPTTTLSRWRWARQRTGTCTPRSRSAISTLLAAVAEYLKDAGYHAPGASADDIQGQPDLRLLARPGRATGGTPPTATCSTTPSEPGWALHRPGLAQWGPPATGDCFPAPDTHAAKRPRTDRPAH